MSGDGTASGPIDSTIESWLKPLAAAPPEPPPVELAPGQRLGRYVLGDKLGRGATSSVFRATDTLLGRDVALKVLLHAPSGGSDDFLREARSAARVHHPGLATVLDAGVDGGVRFIAFELVEGCSLRTLVNHARAGRPIERSRALNLCEQIARAAEAAHGAAIVHRDLKPENVVVTTNDRAKVLDFGLAAAIDSACGWAGTPGYAAPELGRTSADARSDQFAIGVMLVELCTGERPKPGARALDALPPAVRAIARKALAPEPRDRYASAAALADALLAERRRLSKKRRTSLSLLCLVASFLLAPDLSTKVVERAESEVTAFAVESPVVACPPLRTAPGDEWLGAAAASVVCRRARAWLGGGDGIALPPAALLGMPLGPASHAANDPFAEPGMRERAEREADRSADIVLTGTLTREGRMLTLSLSAHGTREAGAAMGSGALPVAVASATDRLFPQIFPGEHAVDPRVTRLIDIDEQAELLAWNDSAAVALSGGGLAWGLERVAALEEAPAVTLARLRMLDGLGMSRDDVRIPDVDGSLESYAGLGPASIALGGPPSPLVIATALASEQPAAGHPDRAPRLASEATAWLASDSNDRARSLALASIAENPWDGPWDVLAVSSYAQPSFIAVGRAYAAWQPEAADAWNIVAQDPALSGQERLAMFARASLVSDGFPLYAGNHGAWLVLLGQREEARRLVADLSLGSSAQRLAAERIATDLDIAEGAVDAAYRRAKRALATAPTIGNAERGDAVLFATLVDLGWLLDRQAETGAFVYETFVAPTPPRLDTGPFAAPRVAHACAHAGPTIARACFARLDELMRAGYFFTGLTPDVAPFVEGAARLSRGDAQGAAESMRRIRELGFGEAALVAEAFHRAGDTEAADRVDAPRRGLFNGVSFSHLRAAERAAESGHCQQARELAKEVQEAWSRSDVELALVSRLGARVDRCVRTR